MRVGSAVRVVERATLIDGKVKNVFIIRQGWQKILLTSAQLSFTSRRNSRPIGEGERRSALEFQS